MRAVKLPNDDKASRIGPGATIGDRFVEVRGAVGSMNSASQGDAAMRLVALYDA
jgi:hypothetical protein